MLPPRKRTILAPEGGWEANKHYIVEVALEPTNVIHRSIFFSGFLNGGNGEPGGYSQLWNPSYEAEEKFVTKPLQRLHYLKVIGCIDSVWPLQGWEGVGC